jgi:hypothetical protein
VTEDLRREDYDPINNEEHRVPPVQTSGLVLPTAPPGREGASRPDPVFVAEPRPPVVSGRMHDRPHFIRNVDGVELCGQCAQPWPCPQYVQDHPEALASSTPSGLVELADVATATGLTVEELRSRLGGQGGRF